MALNLGDITFGLGADITGLEKSLNQLRKFGTEVNKVARSQSKGANEAAAAMVRQESAIRAALIQTQGLVQKLRDLDATPTILARQVTAMRGFTNAMTSGRLSVVDFTRAQDRFRASTERTREAVRNLGLTDAERKQRKLTKVMRDLESASVLAVGPLSGVGARIRALGSISARETLAIAGLIGGITAAVVGIGKLAQSSVLAEQEISKITSAITIATGSTVAAGVEFDKLTQFSLDLNQNLALVGRQYSQLAAAARGTALEGDEIRNVFQSIVKAGTALRLESTAIAGAIKAVEQSISKGVVQAEELRGQLGERIPGVFRIAAEAMGITTQALDEMLRKGQVLAEDLLPKLADRLDEIFGERAQQAARTFTGAVNRVNTTWLLFSARLDDVVGVSDLLRESLFGLSNLLLTMRDNLDVVVGSIGALVGVVAALAAPSIIRGVTALAGAVRNLAAGFTLLTLVTSPIAALGTALGRIVTIAAAATAGFFAFRAAVSDTAKSIEQMTAEYDEFIETAERVGGAVQSITNVLIEERKKQIVALQEELKAVKAAMEAAVDANMIFGLSMREEAESVEGLTKQIAILEEQIKKLETLSAPDRDEGPGKLSTAMKNAKDNVEELVLELKGLRDIVSALPTSASRIDFLEAMIEAREDLRKLSEGELTMLSSQLKAAGFEGATTAESLAMLTMEIDRLETTIEDFRDKAEDTPEILHEFDLEIGRLLGSIEALNRAGTTGLEEFEKAVERADKVAEMREELEKTALTQQEINERLREFEGLLIAFDEAERRAESFEDTVKDIASAFDKSFDRIGKAVTEAFVQGKSEALSFQNIVEGVLSEIVQYALQLTLFEPFKQFASQALAGFVSSAFAPTGAGGPGPGAGPPRRRARGAVLPGPTLFPGGNIGGEAPGKKEALMPLTRTSGGDLGVKATGSMGTTVQVVIMNNNNSQVGVQQRSNGLGDEQILITLDNAMGRIFRRGGEATSALDEMFGAKPVAIGR